MTLQPGDIVRVTYGDGTIFKSPYRSETLGETRKDEILLVIETRQWSVKILHPHHGAGWMTRGYLEVVSEACA